MNHAVQKYLAATSGQHAFSLRTYRTESFGTELDARSGIRVNLN